MFPRIGIGVPSFINSAGGGPPAPSLLLDTYSGAAVAYSLRKLRTDYSGPAITLKVLDGGANPEHQIFFDGNGEVDTTQIQQLCGPFEGVVAQWWDQSGNNNHASQTNILSMPKIYQVVEGSGSILTTNGKPHIQFDGVNDQLNANYINTPTTYSHFVVSKVATIAPNVYTILQINSNSLLRANNGNLQFLTNTGSYQGVFVGFNTNQNLISAIWNGSQNNLALNNNSFSTGSVSGTSITSSTIGIGWQPSAGGNYSNLYAQEIIRYTSNQLTNRTGINTNINTYYGIY